MGLSSDDPKLDGELDGEEEETSVEEAPCVMMTNRGRDAFDLGNADKVDATWLSAESYRSRSVSDRPSLVLLPMR